MRIAMPVKENKGFDSEIALHFGHVKEIAIYDTESKNLEFVNVEEIQGCSPIAAVKDMKIDIIYSFGMGMKAMEMCSEMKIEIKTGEEKTIKEVISNIDGLKTLDESCGH